jgi:SOS-response transcriptional repressor LexA
MTSLRDQQLAWLDHITNSSGLTITEIARAAGLHPSSLTRFRAKNENGHTLTSKTVKKIEDATRVPAYESRYIPDIVLHRQDEAQPFAIIELKNTADPMWSAVETLKQAANHIEMWTLKTSSIAALGYRPGMVVVVDKQATARNGDAVLAQKIDFRRGSAEALFRVYRTPYLLTAYDDGEPGQPEIVDDEQVKISGVIVGGFLLRH